MQNALSSEDLAYLNECRAVAMENTRFYNHAYNANPQENLKKLIGHAAAQKKTFVEAMSAILSGSDQLPVQSGQNQILNFVLDLPEDMGGSDLVKEFLDKAAQHELQFTKSIESAQDFITDKVTLEVLAHHLKAASLAHQALQQSDMG